MRLGGDELLGKQAEDQAREVPLVDRILATAPLTAGDEIH
jgi:hypothetical protein